MVNLDVLKDEDIGRILGKVEVETIIKKIKGDKLKQVERNYLSRSVRPKLRGCSLLVKENILNDITEIKCDKDEILFNLDKYGYGLISLNDIGKKKSLEIEKLIKKILIECPEPRFIEGIPILILKNKINKYGLLEIAIKNDLKNKIGFLLDISFLLAKKFKKKFYLEEELEYLKKSRNEKISMFGKKDKDYIKFLKSKSSERMKKWNLLGRYFDEDFIKIGESYLK